jgi:hypothetical protein
VAAPSAAAPASARSAWTACAWALLLGSSVVYFFTINQADNDLWGHVFFGRYVLSTGAVPRVDTFAYTTAGQRWIDHEWLSQVLFATVYNHGAAAALLLLKFTIGATTVLLLLTRMRRPTTPYVWGGIGVLMIAVLARGFSIRPQIFTYLGVACTLWLLDQHQRGRPRILWCFPPIFLVWANLHGGFILGLAILGLFAVAAGLRVRRFPWLPWMVLLASIAATALNPYGPRLLTYVWGELSRAHPITEWRPASPSDVSQFVFFGLFGLFLVTLPLLRDWRERGWEAVLALAVGILAVRQQRHTAVFALCAAAPVAAQVEAARGWLLKRTPSPTLSPPAQWVVIAGLTALAAVQLVFTGLRFQRDALQIVFDPADYPTAAVAALRQAGARANLAVPLDWGEYVLWFLAPQTKVSVDGRFATLFSERVVEDNFDFFSGAPGWRRLVDQYPTDAALVPVGSRCPIGQLPGWQRVYGDRVAEVYVRSDHSQALRLRPAPLTAPAGIFP